MPSVAESIKYVNPDGRVNDRQGKSGWLYQNTLRSESIIAQHLGEEMNAYFLSHAPGLQSI